jgi:hypothetical protein
MPHKHNHDDDHHHHHHHDERTPTSCTEEAKEHGHDDHHEHHGHDHSHDKEESGFEQTLYPYIDHSKVRW